MPKSFLMEKDGPITTITFNRPEKRNCLNPDVMREMVDLVSAVRDDRNARALIVASTGNSFSAGADLSMVRHIADPAERERAFGEQAKVLSVLIERTLDALVGMRIPAIAAINGYTIGGGWALAVGFDYRIAVEGAEWWFPEVELGVPLTGLAVNLLASYVGPARAKEIIINCRHFKSEELLPLGLVNRVVKPEQLAGAARDLAQTLVTRNPKAIELSKAAVNDWVKQTAVIASPARK